MMHDSVSNKGAQGEPLMKYLAVTRLFLLTSGFVKGP